ncbi:hypothetical protein D3C86_2241430 [compost metagenome]
MLCEATHFVPHADKYANQTNAAEILLDDPIYLIQSALHTSIQQCCPLHDDGQDNDQDGNHHR